MLKVSNVTKYYGNKLAVSKLSFQVKAGEIFGLLGLNGAGKTTTFRMILGLLDDYSGEITLDGKKIDYNTTNLIGYLSEERSLLTKLTVYKQLEYYGVLKGIPIDEINTRVDYWLDRFNMKELKYKKIKELSKGNQQKIQFISAIINNPKLLILDEPFSGLDPVNVELFKDIIKELKRANTAIIFSSHRMEHVEMFCDSIVVLVKGKTVLSGDLASIKNRYKKKNINVIGSIPVDKLSKIKGVNNIEYNNIEYTIGIDDDIYVKDVFDVIKECKDITKFVVEDVSLNQIFIDIVGEYDEG